MQYIVMQPIMDLCERSTWRPGVRVSCRWWDQARIDLEGAKKRAAESTTLLESESESYSNAYPGGEEESRGEEWSWAED